MSFFCRLVPHGWSSAGWHRQSLRWLGRALVLFAVVGCSRLLPGRRQAAGVVPDAATAADAPAVRLLGTVHVIGNGGRFVLVQAPAAAMVTGLIDGQALVCRTGGNITATLRVSHERRPPFVVADVLTGTPNLGDDVFIERAAKLTSPSPAAAATPAVQAAPTPEFRANPALPTGR